MEPILKIVAREYSLRYKNLKDICFLFPNKRCGIFLRKYFLRYGVLTEDLPHILTISEFVSQVSHIYEASHIEQLFVLYNSYRQILGEKIENEESKVEFDSFRGWGETVLSDFNTVDLNLVDPEEIFKNVKDFREISTDFLTEEQKEVMKEYFGVDSFEESGNFWKEFENIENLSSLKQEFINLWQILYPLHEKFAKTLFSKGLGSTGLIYKAATKKIMEKGSDALPYKKIVAVGFNALNESERRIFKILKESEGHSNYDSYIDFIWDLTGPLLNCENLTASRFVELNKRHFPMPKWFNEILKAQETTSYPEVTIISAPSNTSQGKVAGEILGKYTSPENKKMISEAEVALIMPDESLLSNVLYSLPDDIGIVNLTMGISLKQTPISAFMSLLRRVYSSLREGKDEKIFYCKDLKMFFSHPLSYNLFNPLKIEEFLQYIEGSHKISVTQSEISKYLTETSEVFGFPSKKEKGEKIFKFLNLFFEHLKKGISTSEAWDKLQDIEYIDIYIEYLKQLENAVNEYHIRVNPITLMHIIDRLVSSEKIGFEGEPLIGLQVMGTLETRSIDFRHVIILSMNEGIMPRKAMNSTFIPESLRTAYGLPPARYSEEIFSYYFYRLISRAEKVTLIYDGRTISGMRGGESRYLLQLKNYLPSKNLKLEHWEYKLQNHEKKNASIKKTPEIIALTEAFSMEGDKSKNFSASTLNTYRECGVKFFLQSLLNINSDPEKGDFMGAIEIGDVVHATMMDLYMDKKFHYKLLDNPLIIEKEFLESLLKSPQLIKNKIKDNIQKIYYKRKKNEEKIESGVSDLIGSELEELVKEIIKYDINLAPFKLYGCEVLRKIQVTMRSGRKVNFRFAIDRLDAIKEDGDEHLRIVDYKTGLRKRKAKDIEEMFSGGYSSEQIFQLFVYAWLLGKMGIKGWEDVITEIYYVPDLVKGERGLPELEGEKVTSFRKYYKIFSDKLEDLVESIFVDEEFKESSKEEGCRYCSYKSFCGK